MRPLFLQYPLSMPMSLKWNIANAHAEEPKTWKLSYEYYKARIMKDKSRKRKKKGQGFSSLLSLSSILLLKLEITGWTGYVGWKRGIG